MVATKTQLQGSLEYYNKKLVLSSVEIWDESYSLKFILVFLIFWHSLSLQVQRIPLIPE